MGLVAHAQETNYDESEVDTYELPDALTTLNGQKVVNKEQWEEVRRQEIIKLFEDNEYGIMPDATIKSSYRIVEESDNALGGKAIRRQVEITFSNNGQTRQMLVLLYMPKDVKKCPVFVSPNFQGNATTTTDPYVIESLNSVLTNGLTKPADGLMTILSILVMQLLPSTTLMFIQIRTMM